MTEAGSAGRKDVALETMRGIAALIVVFAHSRGAFVSSVAKGVTAPQLFNIFFAGGSAVMFFFVLSGFVLTRRFIEEESPVYLARSILKRYFRLVAPALLSCLISAMLFVTGAYHFTEVAAVTHSPWLAEFGYSIPTDLDFRPSLWDATKNGVFYLFFIPYHHYYNSPLWTMFFELTGSYIVFAAAALIVLAKRASRMLAWVVLAIVLLLSWWHSVFYGAFMLGLGFSMAMTRRSTVAANWVTALLVVVAILLLSYAGPTGEYAFLARLGVKAGNEESFAAVGALLLIIAVETSPPLKRRLSGPIGILLGKLSFPIYLVHFLVLASVGCKVWLMTIALGPWFALVSAFAVTVVVSILAALPLISFDRWWTSLVNRAAGTLIGTRPKARIV